MNNYIRKESSKMIFLSKLEECGYKLISPYLKSRLCVKIRCSQGHEYETTPRSFNRGFRCPVCKKVNKKKEVLKLIEDEGYTLISEYSNNTANKIKLKCTEGHIWETRISDFIRGTRCKCCSIYNKLINAETRFLERINIEKYKLLSKYKGTKNKVLLECPNGHTWRVKPNDFICSVSRCPHCAGSTGQRLLQSMLEENTNHKMIYNDRAELSGLELDIYFPELNIAIEYQGDYWHSKPEAIERDKRKRQLCKDKGIKLIEVWDSEFINNTNKIFNDIIKDIK